LALLRQNAAHQAAEIWESAQVASDDHPYLARKHVPNIAGLRVAPDGRLIAPCYYNGEISGLQYIDVDGGKLWMKGSKSGGAWWHIGDLESASTIYMAEGVATAISIHQASGCPVIIAFSANNLPQISNTYQPKLNQKIIIIADNDESGTGERYAKESGLPYILSPVGDANDFVNGGGDLTALLNPKREVSDWLIPADAFSAQPSPISWLIKRWIQRDALIMVHGPSGGGKTFVVLDWCLRMAAGGMPWCDNRSHASNIVYLAGEGHHGLRGRIAAWRHYHQPNSLNMWLSKGGCDLNTNAGYQQVVDNIQSAEIKPDLIVVDTLHRFLAGDENSAQDAKTMLDACNWLMAEFKCSVLLVHHTGVSDEAQHRARGSSAWRGALDIEISVVPGTEAKPIEIVQRKSKDAEIAQPIFVRLEQVSIPGWIDEDGEQVTSAIIVQSDAPMPEKKLTKSQAILVQAYRTAADSKRGIYASGKFVGVDREVLRDYFYEICREKNKSADNSRRQFYDAIKESITSGDMEETGNCLFFKLPDLAICQASWDEIA